MTSGEPTSVPPTRKTKIAAIGPTTGDHLRDELELNVTVVSPKPGASDLTKALVDFDTSHT
jgi:uroporphyrinogen-III synthase